MEEFAPSDERTGVSLSWLAGRFGTAAAVVLPDRGYGTVNPGEPGGKCVRQECDKRPRHGGLAGGELEASDPSFLASGLHCAVDDLDNGFTVCGARLADNVLAKSVPSIVHARFRFSFGA